MIDIEKLKLEGLATQKFDNSTIIFDDGEPSDDKMYILAVGHAEVYKNYRKTGEVLITTFAPGDFFGEMSLFIDKDRSATIVAKGDVEAFVIDKDGIVDFLATQPEATFAFIQCLCNRLDDTTRNTAASHVRYEQDLTVLIHENSKMETIVNTDALTGVYNRRYFRDVCKILIDSATRTGRFCCIAMFDLDYFKKVNDTYGHDAGDKVLISFAQMVSNMIRSDDMFARYGGEEFIMLITSDSKKSAMGLVNRIRQEVAKDPVMFNDIPISISTSIGVAAALTGEGMDQAISLADQALYQAKADGRNRAVFFEDDDLADDGL